MLNKRGRPSYELSGATTAGGAPTGVEQQAGGDECITLRAEDEVLVLPSGAPSSRTEWATYQRVKYDCTQFQEARVVACIVESGAGVLGIDFSTDASVFAAMSYDGDVQLSLGAAGTIAGTWMTLKDVCIGDCYFRWWTDGGVGTHESKIGNVYLEFRGSGNTRRTAPSCLNLLSTGFLIGDGFCSYSDYSDFIGQATGGSNPNYGDYFEGGDSGPASTFVTGAAAFNTKQSLAFLVSAGGDGPNFGDSWSTTISAATHVWVRERWMWPSGTDGFSGGETNVISSSASVLSAWINMDDSTGIRASLGVIGVAPNPGGLRTVDLGPLSTLVDGQRRETVLEFIGNGDRDFRVRFWMGLFGATPTLAADMTWYLSPTQVASIVNYNGGFAVPFTPTGDAQVTLGSWEVSTEADPFGLGAGDPPAHVDTVRLYFTSDAGSIVSGLQLQSSPYALSSQITFGDGGTAYLLSSTSATFSESITPPGTGPLGQQYLGGFGKWQSPPLKAGTISYYADKWHFHFEGISTDHPNSSSPVPNAGDLLIFAYVWRPTTNAVVGYLNWFAFGYGWLARFTPAPGSGTEGSPSENYQGSGIFVGNGDLALAQVVAEDGDVIVIEVYGSSKLTSSGVGSNAIDGTQYVDIPGIVLL